MTNVSPPPSSPPNLSSRRVFAGICILVASAVIVILVLLQFTYSSRPEHDPAPQPQVTTPKQTDTGSPTLPTCNKQMKIQFMGLLKASGLPECRFGAYVSDGTVFVIPNNREFTPLVYEKVKVFFFLFKEDKSQEFGTFLSEPPDHSSPPVAVKLFSETLTDIEITTVDSLKTGR